MKFKRDKLVVNDINIMSEFVFDKEIRSKKAIEENRKQLTIKHRMFGFGNNFTKGQTFVFVGVREYKYKIIFKRYYKEKDKTCLILEPMWF